MKIFRKKDKEQKRRYISISYVTIDPAEIERYRSIDKMLAESQGYSRPVGNEYSSPHVAQQSHNQHTSDPIKRSLDEMDKLLQEADELFCDAHKPLYELAGIDDPFKEAMELEEELRIVKSARPGVPVYRDGKIYMVTGVSSEDRIDQAKKYHHGPSITGIQEPGFHKA